MLHFTLSSWRRFYWSHDYQSCNILFSSLFHLFKDNLKFKSGMSLHLSVIIFPYAVTVTYTPLYLYRIHYHHSEQILSVCMIWNTIPYCTEYLHSRISGPQYKHFFCWRLNSIKNNMWEMRKYFRKEKRSREIEIWSDKIF